MKAPLTAVSALLIIFVTMTSCLLQGHHHGEDGRICVCAIELSCNDADETADSRHEHEGSCPNHAQGISSCPKISVWENNARYGLQHLSPACPHADVWISDCMTDDSEELYIIRSQRIDTVETSAGSPLRAPPACMLA